MKRIGLGRTAEVFEAGENRILKLFYSGFPEQPVGNEYSNSRTVFKAGIPTPEPYERVEVEGRYGILFSKVKGSTLLKRILKQPFRIKRYARLMAVLHYRLHGVQAEGATRRMKPALYEGIMAAGQLNESEKKKLSRLLDQLPDGNSMCHGDFHPDNIMIDGTGGLWTLDWMNAVSGHPAGDMVRTLLLLEYGTLPEGTPKVVVAVVNFLRRRLVNAYREHYLELSGLQPSELDRWFAPVAAARLVENVPEEEKSSLLRLVRERLDHVE